MCEWGERGRGKRGEGEGERRRGGGEEKGRGREGGGEGEGERRRRGGGGGSVDSIIILCLFADRLTPTHTLARTHPQPHRPTHLHTNRVPHASWGDLQ